MLFILPYRTSIRPWRTPYANYALIIANVIIFLITYSPHYSWIAGMRVLEPLRQSAQNFMLIPNNLRIWQFVTYAFLHGGILHVAGNMFFLYVFGNNVNDKLGHVGYLVLYLAGAVFSGLGHVVLHSYPPVPTLGASGAIAAVTGAYLALFPLTLLTVFYWLFFFIGTMEIHALYFIGFKLIFWDNVLERQIPNVAYDAHLSGYAFGILAVLVLLATGLIKTSTFDLWAMIKQWNRRRQYRDAVSSGYEPYSGRTTTRQIKVKEEKKTADQQKREEEITQLRNEIAGRISQRNLPAAAKIYLELIDLDSEQILPRQYLLDIANQLASENKPAQAAQAYEQFLKHYNNYEYVEQVELMLGILYSRYLQKPDLAVKHLQEAVKKLTDPGQLKMCREELAKLQN
ncbi:MAG: rhomboid family intramembrane serine protease [Phycisphaerae bacterium]|nr:rhomboid family intramembrane serine protease [Phycisphaerae bacterium]